MAKTSRNNAAGFADQKKKENNKSSKNKLKKDFKPRFEEHLEQIPFRLREIMKSKEKMNLASSKRKKTMRAATSKAQSETSINEDIPVPRFRRGKQESESAYLKRMSQETQHVLFLTQNQMERQPEIQLEELKTKSSKQKSEKKKQFDKGRLERLHYKKLQQQEKKAEKDMFADKVQFGEVAMEPPSLTAKPKKAPVKSQGTSKGLLLNSLLGNTASTIKPSMARQRIMEEERERVVQAYRHLKRQKQEQQKSLKGRNKQTKGSSVIS